MAEIMALEQILEILKDLNHHNTINEADSKLIINLVKKIRYGWAPDKVSRTGGFCKYINRFNLTCRT